MDQQIFRAKTIHAWAWRRNGRLYAGQSALLSCYTALVAPNTSRDRLAVRIQHGGFGAAQLGGLWPFKSKGT